MKDYRIIQSEDYKVLQDEINNLLLQGYILIGGINVSVSMYINGTTQTRWYAQAVAKPIDKIKQTENDTISYSDFH